MQTLDGGSTTAAWTPGKPRCHLCDQVEESIDHIIAVCPFSREIWFLVLRAINLTLPAASTTAIRWCERS
jgi:hypothetical protein